MSGLLSEQNETGISRVSRVLNEVSKDLQRDTESAVQLASISAAICRRDDDQDDRSRPTLLHAERLYRERVRWKRTFGTHSDLLHDPAFDILLYVFIGMLRHSEISVSSACYAASTPQTTGLRYIAKLVERGLVERSDDPFDRRRHLLVLTEEGDRLVRRCLGDA